MENLSLLIISLMLFIIAYQVVFVLTLDKKRKGLINDYEKLLNLRDWYQKIADEACSSYIIDSVEKRRYNGKIKKGGLIYDANYSYIV